MKKFIKNNWILIAVIAAGFFLRIYNFKELFLYTHDQDLEGWFIRDVVVNHHLRLIGQETSTKGIFIGPLFYYLLIPFYLATNLDPIGGVFLTLFLGLFTIFSFYYVFSNIFDKNTGLIAALFYSVSVYTVFNDREVVPTMPVILWTVWYLWGLTLLIKGKQKTGYLLLGLLVALTWHLNFALVLLIPLIPLAQYLSGKKFDLKSVLRGIMILTVVSLPLILFEMRHGFSQTQALLSSLTTNQKDIVTGGGKVARTLLLFSKNLHNLLWGDYGRFNYVADFLIFVLGFVLLIYKKLLSPKLIYIFLFWTIVYLVFFSLYSKRLSEYYLNGLIIIFIGIFTLLISNLIKNTKYKPFGYMFLILLITINILRFVNFPVNRSGYVERKAVVAEIKKDSSERKYPCVSISYITDPGYDLGYRYLFWIGKVKLKAISNNVPVYTIVFPQKPVFKTGKDFGAIGLIYPEYEKYNKDIIEKNCSGEDYNLTYPMFGFTD